jgi:hypothetical protein
MRMYYSGSAPENIYSDPDPRLTKDFIPNGIRIMYCRILLGSKPQETQYQVIKKTAIDEMPVTCSFEQCCGTVTIYYGSGSGSDF